jgi:hypothetical protein
LVFIDASPVDVQNIMIFVPFRVFRLAMKTNGHGKILGFKELVILLSLAVACESCSGFASATNATSI